MGAVLACTDWSFLEFPLILAGVAAMLWAALH